MTSVQKRGHAQGSKPVRLHGDTHAPLERKSIVRYGNQLAVIDPARIDMTAAAQMLGMSTGALRSRVWRRVIPFVRVERRIYFDRKQLTRWIDENSLPLKMAYKRGGLHHHEVNTVER